MSDVQRAVVAGATYFLALFAIGFVLGTLRVVFVTPLVGPFFATLAELPLMLAAAFVICRKVIMHWRVPSKSSLRWLMVFWFLALLFTFETLFGWALFARTLAEQWNAMQTPAGLLGVTGQIIAASFPLFVLGSWDFG
jgi:hypothetical protein